MIARMSDYLYVAFVLNHCRFLPAAREQAMAKAAPSETAAAEAVNLPTALDPYGTGRSTGSMGVGMVIRVRFHIIRNARIENIGKSQSCMVSKLRVIWKQTVNAGGNGRGVTGATSRGAESETASILNALEPARMCTAQPVAMSPRQDVMQPAGSNRPTAPSLGVSSMPAEQQQQLRVRFHTIRNARIENVGKSQSCMVSKVRITWKQTVVPAMMGLAGDLSRVEILGHEVNTLRCVCISSFMRA